MHIRICCVSSSLLNLHNDVDFRGHPVRTAEELLAVLRKIALEEEERPHHSAVEFDHITSRLANEECGGTAPHCPSNCISTRGRALLLLRCLYFVIADSQNMTVSGYR